MSDDSDWELVNTGGRESPFPPLPTCTFPAANSPPQATLEPVKDVGVIVATRDEDLAREEEQKLFQLEQAMAAERRAQQEHHLRLEGELQLAREKADQQRRLEEAEAFRLRELQAEKAELRARQERLEYEQRLQRERAELQRRRDELEALRLEELRSEWTRKANRQQQVLMADHKEGAAAIAEEDQQWRRTFDRMGRESRDRVLEVLAVKAVAAAAAEEEALQRLANASDAPTRVNRVCECLGASAGVHRPSCPFWRRPR